jgi:hypothetical protein
VPYVAPCLLATKSGHVHCTRPCLLWAKSGHACGRLMVIGAAGAMRMADTGLGGAS